MKKRLLLGVCILGLTACSSRMSTLSDFFSWGDDDTAPVAVAEPNTGYRLAKRGDRYASADYVISPQVYGIVATRAVNKMLAEAPAIFAADKDAPLYIAETTVIDRYLPEGSYAAGKTAKEILVNSGMFNIVDDESKAAFVLKSSLNNVNTPEIPVLLYRLELYDINGDLAGSWQDSLRQVQNDDGSWW